MFQDYCYNSLTTKKNTIVDINVFWYNFRTQRFSYCIIENKSPLSRVIFEDCTIKYNSKKSAERSNAKY